jgi:hypothetical protein
MVAVIEPCQHSNGARQTDGRSLTAYGPRRRRVFLFFQNGLDMGGAVCLARRGEPAAADPRAGAA